jgi:uncharacterized protein (TIGR02466 family)
MTMEGLIERWTTPILRRVERKENDPAHRALHKLILAHEQPAERKADSPQPLHRNVFESEFDFLDWREPASLALKQLMHRRLAEVILHSSNFGQEMLLKLKIVCESWFHITRSGGYVRSHNHPQHSWSAIYCVDPGDPEPEYDHDAGHLLFFDPRNSAGMFLDMANSELTSSYNFHTLRFRPSAGELIIFPSYVWHAVEPYHGERPRITVAANFRFNLPTPPAG